ASPEKRGSGAAGGDPGNAGPPEAPPQGGPRAVFPRRWEIGDRGTAPPRFWVARPPPAHARPWNCPIEVTRRSPCLTASRAHRSVSSVESVRTRRQRSIDSMSSDRRPQHVAGSGKIMRRNIVGDWPFPYQQKFALSRTEENHV